MPASNCRYCVLGIHWADSPAQPEILCLEQQVVVFETLQMAREVVPRLSGGRLETWDAAQEVCRFAGALPGEIARISILTGYDVYDVLNGLRAKGIWSEAAGRDWKHHILWSHVWRELLAWADSQEPAFEPMMAA